MSTHIGPAVVRITREGLHNVRHVPAAKLPATPVLYAPGLRGYLKHLRLPELLAECRTGYAPDRTAALRAFGRRVRPGARLRQSETERVFWQQAALASVPAQFIAAKAETWLRHLDSSGPLENLDDVEAGAAAFVLEALLDPEQTPDTFPCH